MQKRAIRCLCGLKKSDSCQSYFRENKILTLPFLYMLEAALYIKRNLQSLQTIGDYHSYNTRNKTKLEIVKHQISRYEKKTTYRGIKIYEKLPAGIKKEKDYNKFKSLLKAYLLEKNFYSVIL